jgi:hypothetical protein
MKPWKEELADLKEVKEGREKVMSFASRRLSVPKSRYIAAVNHISRGRPRLRRWMQCSSQARRGNTSECSVLTYVVLAKVLCKSLCTLSERDVKFYCEHG